ncbi:hypothetical protein E2C01_084102 [Portunus trituberculatus]|uniref:Uncharacterized protein n=1 Tax=Portunus trituberculatus TaxID=210409 RepID=A0A5B7J6J7_PORTR|nr:hypothetical protein [Portunus trituberculatus]
MKRAEVLPIGQQQNYLVRRYAPKRGCAMKFLLFGDFVMVLDLFWSLAGLLVGLTQPRSTLYCGHSQV